MELSSASRTARGQRRVEEADPALFSTPNTAASVLRMCDSSLFGSPPRPLERGLRRFRALTRRRSERPLRLHKVKREEEGDDDDDDESKRGFGGSIKRSSINGGERGVAGATKGEEGENEGDADKVVEDARARPREERIGGLNFPVRPRFANNYVDREWFGPILSRSSPSPL